MWIRSQSLRCILKIVLRSGNVSARGFIASFDEKIARSRSQLFEMRNGQRCFSGKSLACRDTRVFAENIGAIYAAVRFEHSRMGLHQKYFEFLQFRKFGSSIGSKHRL